MPAKAMPAIVSPTDADWPTRSAILPKALSTIKMTNSIQSHVRRQAVPLIEPKGEFKL
jgi:hypothetical protein